MPWFALWWEGWVLHHSAGVRWSLCGAFRWTGGFDLVGFVGGCRSPPAARMAGVRDSWGVVPFEWSGFLAEVSRCPPRGYHMSGLSPWFVF